MAKFKYMITDFATFGSFELMQSQLDDIGNEGWEICASFSRKGMSHLILKKPVVYRPKQGGN